MIPTLESIIDGVLEREGGFVAHPADRGGPSKFGVTLAALAAWRQRPVSAEDVRALTEDEARSIYRSRYLTEPGLHRIKDPYVLSLAFDCAVHHGPRRAIRWLQQCVHLVDDGNLGDATEVAVNTADPGRLYCRVLGQRLRFVGRLITNDPTQAAFAAGWMARIAGFLEEIP